MWGYGLDRSGSGQGQVVGTCECGNEPSGSIKYGEFLDQLRTVWLLKKDSAPWRKCVSLNIFKTTLEKWINGVHPYGIPSELLKSQTLTRAGQRPRAREFQNTCRCFITMFHNNPICASENAHNAFTTRTDEYGQLYRPKRSDSTPTGKLTAYQPLIIRERQQANSNFEKFCQSQETHILRQSTIQDLVLRPSCFSETVRVNQKGV